MTNGGPHGVINLAPAKKAMEDSVLYVRKRGTLVFIGFPKENTVRPKSLGNTIVDHSQPEMNSFYIVYNCLTIKGSLTGNRQDVDDAIAFVTNGTVKVSKFSWIMVYFLINLSQLSKHYNVFKHLVIFIIIKSLQPNDYLIF